MLSDNTTPLQETSRSQASDSSISRWILLAAAIWCVCWFVHAWHYWEDDAYIHLEYARSIATGHGYSFDGLLVNGDTAPLWVLLLVAVHAVIPNWLIAGKVLTVLGAVFALTGTYYFSKHLVQGLDGADTFAAWMVLLLVTNPFFCYWSFSGMETLTAVGLAFWGTLLAVKKQPTWGSFYMGCFVAGIAPVLRPEMMAFSGLVGLLFLRQWFRFPGRPLSGRKLFALLFGLVLVVLPVALWSAYALHAFGHVIPNTNAAKRAGPGDSVVKRLLKVYGLGFPLVLAEIAGLGAIAVIRPALVRKDSNIRNPLRLLPVAGWIFVIWCVVACAFYIVDHTWVQTRYVFVMTPGLMFAALAFNYRRLPRLIYSLSLTGALVAAVSVSSTITWLLIRNKVIGGSRMQIMAEYVRDHVPPDAPVAIYAIGEMAFDSQHPIVDIGGITRPGAIPYLFDSNDNGMVRWAQAQGARYFLSLPQPEPGATLVFSVNAPYVGWSLDFHKYSQTGSLRLWKLPGKATQAPPLGSSRN
ncbi:MAG TPA: hypothetical protein VME86_02965 [Acidobacteriaceae bacterium]|nr:hypothetical protein [Acidobacteriaceae bacterium]